MTRVAASGTPASPRPEVIVDFTVEEGLLFVHLANVGGGSAFAVRTRFSAAIRGAGGRRRLDLMRLFRRVDFIPPGKRFTHFIDTLTNYVKTKQPTRIVATVSYRDRERVGFEQEFRHNLATYLELCSASLRRTARSLDSEGRT